MADEFKHKSVGAELTQAEFEAIGGHDFASQAAGDIMYASSSTQLTRLAKGSDAEVLTLASGIPSWAALPGATKEFFVPVTFGRDSGVDDKIIVFGKGPVVALDAINDRANVFFKVPHDFSSITNAEFIVIGAGTDSTANWDIFSYYGAIGQAYTTHTEDDVSTTYDVANEQFFAVDISGILSSLLADDYVGIEIKLATAAHNFYAVGVRFRYS